VPEGNSRQTVVLADRWLVLNWFEEAEGARSLERQRTMSGSYVQRGSARLGIGQTEEAC